MKPQKKTARKKASFLFSVILSGLAVFSLLINLLWPDRARSMVENRPLAQFPAPGLSSLADGQFQQRMTDWFSDQFVGRDTFFHLSYLTKKATGIRQIDDVYLGKNCLIQESPSNDPERMSQKAQAISSFYGLFPVHTMVAIAPTADWTEREKLPAFAQSEDEQKDIQAFYDQLDPSIERLDVADALNNMRKDYIYYRTDHHWTSLGAWQAASAVLQASGEEPSLDNYDRMPVATDFQGTLQSKTGSLFLRDTIDIYVAKNNPDYLVMYNNDGQYVPTIYDDSALKNKDKYEVFFGGNDSLVQISMNTQSTRHLLIFKDSYANSMIQFLLPYYRTITVVDPRYYYDNISRLVESNMITDVLYLYNYSSFQTDTSLLDVLNSAQDNAASSQGDEGSESEQA